LNALPEAAFSISSLPLANRMLGWKRDSGRFLPLAHGRHTPTGICLSTR